MTIAATIAVLNLKGGVGKTTLAIGIGATLAAFGPVVLVDADGQATAMAWAAGGKLPMRVEALPLDSGRPRDVEAWLARLVALKAGAAFLMVDLPPNLGAVTTAALTVTDLAVIPVPPSGMDINASSKAMHLLRQARLVRRGNRPAALLVPSRVDRRTGAGREIEAVLSDFREPVGPAIVQRAAHVDAFSAGRWIGDYAPRSAAHTEMEALAAVVKRMATRGTEQAA